MTHLIQIRKKLHQMAEISGKEKNTSKFIADYLKSTSPARIIENIGGYGVAAEYGTDSHSPVIMLRADIDALPITETNNFDYISINKGISHKCGHDGHTTILLGIAQKAKSIADKYSCRIILLFQPAEETATGAKAILEDEKFESIQPDYIFGLHNLPGYPKGSIIVRDGVFSSASKGFSVHFQGRTSHAAHPEEGKSPVLAMINTIQGLMALPSLHTKLEDSANVTIIHASLGEIAFGTSPGKADVMATFRSYKNRDMDKISTEAAKICDNFAAAYHLKHNIEWHEEFPANVNHEFCNSIIRKSAEDLGMDIVQPEIPFPWSEDFAYYTGKYKGAFFGLGAGLECPGLHNPDYDFQDDIIDKGIEIFTSIITNILEKG